MAASRTTGKLGKPAFELFAKVSDRAGDFVKLSDDKINAGLAYFAQKAANAGADFAKIIDETIDLLFGQADNLALEGAGGLGKLKATKLNSVNNPPVPPNPNNPNPIPTNTNQVPANTNQVPANTNQIPANTNQIPANTNQIPANTNQVPANTNQVPANTNQVPANTNQIPANTNQNVSTNQNVNQNANQRPTPTRVVDAVPDPVKINAVISALGSKNIAKSHIEDHFFIGKTAIRKGNKPLSQIFNHNIPNLTSQQQLKSTYELVLDELEDILKNKPNQVLSTGISHNGNPEILVDFIRSVNATSTTSEVRVFFTNNNNSSFIISLHPKE